MSFLPDSVSPNSSVSNPINLEKTATSRVVVLTIAASDSSGFAGISMDTRTQTAMGVHSALVVTANTAQTNEGVVSINPVASNTFKDQLITGLSLKPAAIKIGLLVSIEQIKQVAEFLSKKALQNIPVIIDPVLESSSGVEFSSTNIISAYRQYLLSYCTLLTPNIDEVEKLTGIKVICVATMKQATQQLLALGVQSVLVKGGHLVGNDFSEGVSQDYFSDTKQNFFLGLATITTDATRATGCALSSAIASSFALGYSIYDAVVIGKMAISQGLRHAYTVEGASLNKAQKEMIGKKIKEKVTKRKVTKEKSAKKKKYGPVNIQFFPNQEIDLPVLTLNPISVKSRKAFPDCNCPVLGLYPVVDRADWIKDLAPAGVTTIQLRIKDLTGALLKAEIQSAIRLANDYHIRLFINDYWELAIECGAYGVHLGQEDIDDADLDAIFAAGLRLGLSTHCHYEVARAHYYKPSYIACGPVYHTETKDMPWVPHGLNGLSYWRSVLSYPLVAIGGINVERFDGVKATGVDSIAMITAITLADEPVSTAKILVEKLRE